MRKSFERSSKKKSNPHIKLVEPSLGRIVELQVTDTKKLAANLYLGLLTAYAQGLEQYGVQWTVTNNVIRLTFPDRDMAETVREDWKK